MMLKFPSPYGVSFILIIYSFNILNNLENLQFPSPYGVSFILISSIYILNKKVVKFPSPYGVSFILMNAAPRYQDKREIKFSFRLLTEYHSFLSCQLFFKKFYFFS